VDTPHLVEAMLAGLICDDEACQAYPDLGYLRARAELTGVPLQWLLAVVDAPLARGLVRHAARALLALAETAEAGWQCGAEDGCGLWHALQQAPPWLLRPAEADDEETDIALLLLRDQDCSGDWNALIEALHRVGSRPWQWAIQRCRDLQQFEQATQCSLNELLAAPTAKEE